MRSRPRRFARVRQPLASTFLAGAALLLLVCFPLAASAAPSPYCQSDQAPQIGAGFRDLVSAVGDAVGDAVECEHADGLTGDVQQQTTGGLLYWRKSTNTPAFTDGEQHWALQAGQVVTWGGEAVDPPGTNVARPAARPVAVRPAAPTPTAAIAPISALVVSQIEEPPPVFSMPPLTIWTGIVLLLLVLVGSLMSGRLLYMLGWLVFTTTALSALVFASAYTTTWHQPGADWLVPITISSGPDSPQDISKNSLEYWIWTPAVIGLFVTFPQAVLNTLANLAPTEPLDGRIKVTFVRLAQTWGIGVGFIVVVFAFNEWLNPFRTVQWLLILGSIASLVLIMGNVLWLDVTSGIRRDVRTAIATT
jgi:hypothetical protein